MNKVTEADDKLKKLQKQQVAYKLQSFVNTLSLNIKILSDWEELEVSQNPFLTSKPLLDTLLKNIVDYSSKCKEEILPLNEKEVSESTRRDASVGGHCCAGFFGRDILAADRLWQSIRLLRAGRRAAES